MSAQGTSRVIPAAAGSAETANIVSVTIGSSGLGNHDVKAVPASGSGCVAAVSNVIFIFILLVNTQLLVRKCSIDSLVPSSQILQRKVGINKCKHFYSKIFKILSILQ